MGMRFRYCFLVAALVVSAGLAAAQGLSQLTGTVTDPTGAVVPNASVKLESVTRGTARDETTDAQGRYHFLQIQPDKYRLRAKATGFREIVVGEVTIQVNTPATVDLRFEVGTVTESVTVSSQAVQLNTTDATIGNALGTTPILQLPSFARNVAGLLALQPGVTTDGNVNGGKADQGNVTLDGIDVNNQMERSAFTSVLRVTLDSVQEFRTTTTNANADQGRSSGAQVQLVTRSGSNAFHGAAYWYNRYTGLSANSFFNNKNGVKRPLLNINIPGARFGGPIKRDKAFFFLNWEMRKDKSEENTSRIVPSLALRSGNITYLSTSGQSVTLNSAQLKALDPLGIGPSAAAMQLMNTYPAPNDPNLGDRRNRQGFRFVAPRPRNNKTYTAKFDYNFSDKHTANIRGQLQNDSRAGAPQFPGQQPNSVELTNAKGIAVNFNSVFTTNLVNSARYGLTRLSTQTTGIQSQSAVSFRSIDDASGLSTGISRQIPVHQWQDDVSWTKGNHTVQGGFVMRLIQNQSTNYAATYHSASTNVSWLRGTGADLRPSDVASSDTTSYGDAAAALLGIVTQVNGRYNYDISGKVLGVGVPRFRNFGNEEYEMFGQDTWRVTRNLTLTFGLRWSLMPPIHELNGVQISTNQSIGEFFDKRGGLMRLGKSQQEAGRIIFIKTDDPKARPIYPYHKDNFAPRFSVAYSPSGTDGLSKLLFGGPGKTSIRAGWGMYYDLIGQPLARTYDASAFGFATTLTNPSGSLTTATAPRFTGQFNLPTAAPNGTVMLRAAPPGGFPQEYPNILAITNSIDDTLKSPYTMNMNLSIGRDLGRGWYVQGSYVGRQSRRSLMNRDLAMPTDLRDPASGQTYFQAATQLELYRKATASQPAATSTANVPRIPFFENMFRTLATSTQTASQRWFGVVRQYPNDFTSALFDIDAFCDPECGVLGANMLMNPQFSALSAWSSVGGGNYHAFQWSVRKSLGDLTLDLNYTLSKSTDLGSSAENAGSFSGFMVNSWEPDQRRGVSDYDQRHIVNAWWVYEAPFGKGKRWGSGVNRIANAFIGGWQISGVWTQSSGLPESAGNGRVWPTNWNITGFGTPVGAISPASITKNGPAGGPNLWPNPAQTLTEWVNTLPGQSGSRNTVRGTGRANWDMAFAKRFQMPWAESHSLQFRWEIFNMFNQVRFSGLDIGRSSSTTWGNFTDTRGDPRQMQLALRYEF